MGNKCGCSGCTGHCSSPGACETCCGFTCAGVDRETPIVTTGLKLPPAVSVFSSQCALDRAISAAEAINSIENWLEDIVTKAKESRPERQRVEELAARITRTLKSIEVPLSENQQAALIGCLLSELGARP